MSPFTRKPVLGVSVQLRLKPACSATEASWSLEILDIETIEILYYLGSEQQRLWSDSADVQADLRHCYLHMAKTGFLNTRLKCILQEIFFLSDCNP